MVLTLNFNETMKKLYIPFVVLSSLCFFGCSDDFLDVDQTETISTSDLALYNNNEGAKSFVTSIYAKFLDWNMSSFSWNGMTSIASLLYAPKKSPAQAGQEERGSCLMQQTDEESVRQV